MRGIIRRGQFPRIFGEIMGTINPERDIPKRERDIKQMAISWTARPDTRNKDGSMNMNATTWLIQERGAKYAIDFANGVMGTPEEQKSVQRILGWTKELSTRETARQKAERKFGKLREVA